ncbi:MAG: hypothetical protein CSB55_08155 [Candidatus Cloacimonadota bacterium]|nr:MAG: hypothetical protein CSB55_08155 [Candidatus Cloacimonadota bacterium]
MKKILFICLAFLALANILNAGEIVLNPSDDMYTDLEHPAANPDQSQLWVADFNPSNHHERIMIKFDLSELQDKTVTSAVLSLSRFFSCPSSGTTSTNFYAITQDWNENTWNPHEHVAFDQNISMPYVFSGPGGGNHVEFDVDITDFLNAMIDAGMMNGFIIKSNPNQKFSKFYSKDCANPAYRPKLTVTYSDVANDDVVENIGISLKQNYPNPFSLQAIERNGATNIEFSSDKDEEINLSVFDVKGRLVKELVNGKTAKGPHTVSWDGKDYNNKNVASGIYFYRLKTSSRMTSKKIIVVK